MYFNRRAFLHMYIYICVCFMGRGGGGGGSTILTANRVFVFFSDFGSGSATTHVRFHIPLTNIHNTETF